MQQQPDTVMTAFPEEASSDMVDAAAAKALLWRHKQTALSLRGTPPRAAVSLFARS